MMNSRLFIGSPLIRIVEKLLNVVVLLLLVAFAEAQSPVWLPSFQHAFDQLKRGELSVALGEFQKLGEAYPRDVQLSTSIGGVLDATSHHDQATAWYRRALAIQPEFGPAIEDLAMNCAARGKLDEAAILMRRQLRQNPNDANAAYNLGLILIRLRSYSEAVAILNRAAALSNSPVPLAQIRLAKATAQFHLGHYEATVKELLTSGKPNSAEAFQLLGSAQALSGDLPASIKTFQGAIDSYPAVPELYFRLAMVFAEGRRDQDAQAALGTATERFPDSPVVAYGRAVVAEREGLNEEAIAWAQKSIGNAKSQPEVWGLLGALFDRTGRTADALGAYETALTFADNPYIGAQYAELLIRLQRYAEATKKLRDLLAVYPEDAQVNRALGKLYRAENKYAEAETYLRRSIRSDTNDPQSHYVLAQVLQHEKRMDEAAKELMLFKNTKSKSSSIRILEIAADSN